MVLVIGSKVTRSWREPISLSAEDQSVVNQAQSEVQVLVRRVRSNLAKPANALGAVTSCLPSFLFCFRDDRVPVRKLNFANSPGDSVQLERNDLELAVG